jgi:hypothetical protein
MFAVNSKASSSGAAVTFPDVCKVPAPPAPFVPVPYPNIQYQENLKVANKVDAMTKTGNKTAQIKQKQAIDNLYKQAGIRATSATQAVILGKTAHGKQPVVKKDSGTSAEQNTVFQRASRQYSTLSNISKSHHDILNNIINNLRA